MNINLTIIGQMISFIFFVFYCMKYIWPPLINIIEKRENKIKKNFLDLKNTKKNFVILQNEIITYFVNIQKDMIKVINKINKYKNIIVNRTKNIALIEYINIIKIAKKEIKIKYNYVLEKISKKIIEISLINTKKILYNYITEQENKKINNKIINFL